MDVWDWIDYLAKGLKKVANESQQNYQQVHAYIDGHDRETVNHIYGSIRLKSPNGTVWKVSIDDKGNLVKEKA